MTRPPEHGGLGFGYKWDLGWMHDTLAYLEREPVHRKWHHDELTFRALYANSENYVLPLSHDEVVHGKKLAAREDAGRSRGRSTRRCACCTATSGRCPARS